MQKLIGSILILVSAGGAGYMYGQELRRYLAGVRYLRYVAGLIQGEMEYTGAPLAEIFFQTAGSLREPYRSWLIRTAEETERREDRDFPRIWIRCADRYLAGLGLRPEHASLIREMGAFMGQLDRATSGRSMELYLNRMDLEIEKLREGLDEKRRVGGCLGIMGGLFLVVLLL